MASRLTDKELQDVVDAFHKFGIKRKAADALKLAALWGLCRLITLPLLDS